MIRAHTGTAVRKAEQPLLDQGQGDVLMDRAARGLADVCESYLQRILSLSDPAPGNALSSSKAGSYKATNQKASNQKVSAHKAGDDKSSHGSLSGSAVVVLVGSGNNGGDGLWAGSFLSQRGASVTAVLTGSRAHEKGLAALRAAGGEALRLSQETATDGGGTTRSPESHEDDALQQFSAIGIAQAANLMASADVVVDAMLGTGASGGLRGGACELVTQYLDEISDQAQPPRVIACDVVSGVNADTGEVPGTVLPAHATVTFGVAKVAHVVAPGEQVTGELTVVPIGIEDHVGSPDALRIESADALAAWPRPTARDHKYSRGVLGVVAGTAQYPGAAVLATTAAVNSGVGMVRYLGDSATRHLVLSANPEVVCSEDQPWDVHVQAWLAGPGVVGDEAQEQRAQAVIEAPEPAVLDAGALSAAARSVADARLGAHKILTPHAGELAQIFEWLHGLGISHSSPQREEIEATPQYWVRQAARLTGATVLLKGATTAIASPVAREFDHRQNGQELGADADPAQFLCLSVGGASPWLATAGSGDTLSGILATVVAHVSEHPDLLGSLGHWARGDGRWAAAAALGASIHGQASWVGGEGPVPPTVLASNVRTVLRTAS